MLDDTLEETLTEIDIALGNTLTYTQFAKLKEIVANYGLACVIDSSVRREAENFLSELEDASKVPQNVG